MIGILGFAKLSKFVYHYKSMIYNTLRPLLAVAVCCENNRGA